MNLANQEQVAASPRRISEADIKQYFVPKDESIVILMIIAGVLFFITGLFSQFYGLMLVGLALAIIGGGLIIVPRIESTQLTDTAYDAWLKAQANTLLRAAIKKLNIDSQNTQGYLQVHGFVLAGMRAPFRYRLDELRYKRGKDGIIRYSVNVFTYFFPTDQSVVVFISDINAINPSAHNEKTQEYFYRDIVGVTTSDEQTAIGLYQYRVQRFSVRVSNGDTIDISVEATPVGTSQNLPSFTVQDSGIDNTVAALRRILREAKQTDT